MEPNNPNNEEKGLNPDNSPNRVQANEADIRTAILWALQSRKQLKGVPTAETIKEVMTIYHAGKRSGATNLEICNVLYAYAAKKEIPEEMKQAVKKGHVIDYDLEQAATINPSNEVPVPVFIFRDSIIDEEFLKQFDKPELIEKWKEQLATKWEAENRHDKEKLEKFRKARQLDRDITKAAKDTSEWAKNLVFDAPPGVYDLTDQPDIETIQKAYDAEEAERRQREKHIFPFPESQKSVKQSPEGGKCLRLFIKGIEAFRIRLKQFKKTKHCESTDCCLNCKRGRKE